MGNCIGISSKSKNHQNGPSPVPQEAMSPTTRTNTPFIGTPDPIGFGAGSFSPSNATLTTIPSSNEIVEDQRLLSLLEFFQQLHFRRRDIFKQIVPVHRKDFEEIFEKMKNNQQENKEQHRLGGGVALQRSRSVNDLKKERFKVKPIDSPNDKVKGGGSKPAASK